MRRRISCLLIRSLLACACAPPGQKERNFDNLFNKTHSKVYWAFICLVKLQFSPQTRAQLPLIDTAGAGTSDSQKRIPVGFPFRRLTRKVLLSAKVPRHNAVCCSFILLAASSRVLQSPNSPFLLFFSRCHCRSSHEPGGVTQQLPTNSITSPSR